MITRKTSMSTGITLQSLDNLSAVDLHMLPTSILGDLQQQLADDQEALDKRYAILWTEFHYRFASLAQSLRRREGKDTGTVHITIDDCDIACITSKCLTWDNVKLLQAMDQLSEDEQKQYLIYHLSVAEEKFQHAPPAIKALLEPARTMTPTRETFTITQKDN